MSGMVLTPVSPTPEKSIERQGATSESERPSERFDDVSAREKARLERKEARQERADQRVEDSRVASRQAEQDRLEESRAKQSQQADKADEIDAPAKAEDRPPERSSSQSNASDTGGSADDASGKAETTAKHSAEEPAEDGIIGDEVLPMLFSVPSQQNAASQAVKGLAIGGSSQGTALPTASGTTLDKLMMQPQQGVGAGSDDMLLGSKGESSGLLAGKAALGADGKAVDFSAQLARYQGGGDTSSPQNSATGLQRGLEGRESMAMLKSYSTSVDLPVQHAEWGEKVAGKLAWLTNQRMSAAEIHITPPDLGPLEVRVQVQHDQAHVTVHATHAAVRDQLELNGHRLRDMLQENGLNLDKFEVSAESSDQGAQQQLAEDGRSGGGGYGRSADAELDTLDEPMAGGSLDLSWRGEVDLYA